MFQKKIPTSWQITYQILVVLANYNYLHFQINNYISYIMYLEAPLVPRQCKKSYFHPLEEEGYNLCLDCGLWIGKIQFR